MKLITYIEKNSVRPISTIMQQKPIAVPFICKLIFAFVKALQILIHQKSNYGRFTVLIAVKFIYPFKHKYGIPSIIVDFCSRGIYVRKHIVQVCCGHPERGRRNFNKR